MIIALALVMGSAFALSYSLALGRPAPRGVPVGVVGPSRAADPLVTTLQTLSNHGLRPTPFSSLAAADRALSRQDIYAIIDATGSMPRLIVSSAGGASVSRVLEQLAQRVPRADAVQVSDAHPLPASDPQGLTTFYVTIAATIIGFVTMFQLRSHMDHVSLRGWIGLLLSLVVLGGGVLTAVSDLALSALHGPFAEIWLLLSMQCAVAALFNSTMIVLIGRWAILPTWTLFIVLGNTSSGGAVAAPLLPGVYAFLNRYLPTGATVSALHTAVYFRGYQHAEPFVVLAAWIAVTATALMLSSRRLGRTPTD
ncbi:MAG: hypothetical protein JWM76_1274 [Pseudonocardiales bacterium]|nr:hypothetical protein [Pseudonocardiales bacterium]